MTDQELLIEAYQRGAAWNPAYPSLANLDLGRIALMDGSERDAKDLIASRQQSDANMELLVRAFHAGRELQPDGDIGPATRALVEIPRCPIPDFAPPPGASFHYDDPGLQRAVETQQQHAEATGSGSWPAPGCDGGTAHHSIVVRIDPANMPSTIKAYHVQALAEVSKAYAEIGIAVRYVLDSSSKCQIAKRFQGIPGGVIGWNEFPPSGTCNATIDGRLDTGYAPGNWLLWANLECHETGHGVGLQHTRGSIMNPSILLVDPLTWVGTPSYSTLARYFGGKPIAGTPTPPPGPGPTPPSAPGSLKLPIKITDADGKSYGIHPWSDV